MARYRITETVVYEVEADDEQEAEDLFLNSDDPEQYLSYIDERDVEAVG